MDTSFDTALPDTRLEVLVGGRCELHLDDGTLLQGELQPAPIDGAALQVQTAAGPRTRSNRPSRGNASAVDRHARAVPDTASSSST